MNIGNKAQNLIKLRELGYFVPDFEVVPFSDIILDFEAVKKSARSTAHSYLISKISLNTYQSRTSKIIKNLKLDRQKLIQVSDKLTRVGYTKISFRTSALGEDGPHLSFAGQYRTFLDKTLSARSLSKYAKACFSSTLDARVVEYLKVHQAKNLQVGGSVIVQQMFYGQKSGVLFTEDGSGHLTINSVDSWHNTVVEGDLTDTFRFKKNHLDRTRAPKVLKRLAGDSIQLENQLGTPLDIEWAVRGSKIAFLQMRPQTTRNLDYSFEWDSTNISESYPGITLPLTYSFIRNLYANVYPAFLSMIGTPRATLEHNREVFDNALGYLDGRVYYRISNWYEIVKLIPGKNNQKYFEAMLNPAKKLEPGSTKSKFDPKSFFVKLRFGRMLLGSPRMSKKFRKIFEQRFTIYDNSKMEHMNANALLADIQSVQKELLSLWSIPILNDVRVMIWHGILKSTITKKADNDTYLELLSGLSERSSIKPLLALRNLGVHLSEEMSKHNIATAERLAEHPPAIALTRKYVLDYGARTPDELKLENPRLVDSIANVISLALRAKDSPIEPVKEHTQDLSQFSFSTRMLLKLVINNTRSAIDWREHFRLNRAQVFNLARRAYLQIGHIFVQDHIIDEQNDIFYLTDHEIESIINAHAWEYTAQEIIARRKKQYKKYAASQLPRRVIGSGTVAARHIEQTPENKPTATSFAGTGVSPGVISAEIIIATKFDPSLDVRGKILVATHIDPGWTLIFTQAIGVITERGNALSHVSIITRELGIPAVVALSDATKRLQNGQTVKINGSTGEVTINEKS